jgi:hypothetical protein
MQPISSPFNARNASPKEIANSFVVPEYFEQAARFQNLVLVGPRGIGKTTLMKVLTSTGLLHLHQRPELKEFLSTLDFSYIPVYIPAESIWKGTAQLISEDGLGEEERDLLLNGLFVDHCLHQLICSLEDASRGGSPDLSTLSTPWSIEMSPAQEAEISVSCSELWQLERPKHSLLGLKLGLIQRANGFRSVISSLTARQSLTKTYGPAKVARLDLLLMLKGFFDIIDTVIGPKRWAVSFDEMEIAPKRVLQQLYENLRSFDQRAVLKFSLFPFMDFYQAEERLAAMGTGPVDGQDYHSIVLTSRFANADYSFARRIFQQECVERGVDFGAFTAYLNKSTAVHRGSREAKSTGFERRFDKIFASSVRSGDRKFVDFMKANDLGTEEAINDLRGENKRAQLLRKIAPIAEIRSYYFSRDLKQLDSEQRFRRSSAKGYGYYHGFDQLLALSESNPRAIKYFMNELIPAFVSGEISSVAQNRIIPRNVDRFRALIAAHTYSSGVRSSSSLATLFVIDTLGNFLAENLLSEEFQPQPPLSFSIKSLAPDIRDAIILGINSGGLIADQRGDGRQLLFDLEDCRIRISHRLAPYFKLPTITGQSRMLSHLPAVDDSRRQPDLLNWIREQ